MRMLALVVLSWLAGSALAQEMSRYGTMIYEDDGGGSGGVGGFAALGAFAVMTFVLYRAFKRWMPQYSDEANFNFAWIAALALGGVLLSLMR